MHAAPESEVPRHGPWLTDPCSGCSSSVLELQFLRSDFKRGGHFRLTQETEEGDYVSLGMRRWSRERKP